MSDEQMFSIQIPDPPNFEWHIGEDFVLSFIVKKTLFNRFKWWLSTKLFLPGTYNWIDYGNTSQD